MGIAEKALVLKRDFDEVYKAGASDFGLKGKGQGELVTLNNVHPIEHKVEVGLSSKNLFNEDTANITKTEDYFKSNVGYSTDAFYSLAVEPNETYIATFMIRTEVEHVWGAELGVGIGSLPTYGQGRIELSLIPKESYQNFATHTIRFTVPADVHIVYFQTDTEYKFKNFQIEKGNSATVYAPYVADFSDCKVKVSGKNLLDINSYVIWTDNGLGFKLENLIEGQKYTFSTNLPIREAKASNAPWGYTCGGSAINANGFNHYTFVFKRAEQLTADTPIYLFIKPVGADNFIGDIAGFDEYQLQIEYGETPTEYTEYIEPTEYTAAADGTVEGVKSISPVMNLMADKAGAVIDAECFLDPQAVITDLTNTVITLGGEI